MLLDNYHTKALNHLVDQWDFVEHMNFASYNRRAALGKGRNPTQGMTTLQRIKFKIMQQLTWKDPTLFRSTCFGILQKSESVTQFRARVSKALNRVMESVEAKNQADDKSRDADYSDPTRQKLLFAKFTAMQQVVLDALRPFMKEVCRESKTELMWSMVQTEKASRKSLEKYEKVLCELKDLTKEFIAESEQMQVDFKEIEDIEARL